MGFPVGYTEVFFPNIFLHTLSLLGFIRALIFSLFHLLGLSELLETTDAVWPHHHSYSSTSDHHHTYHHHSPPASALLIRELLPVIRFSEIAAVSAAGDPPPPESCAVCLHEFEGGEEIRWLANCRHVFHRECLDRWIDHDQSTCPLCRTSFVPEEMRDEYNQRLWAASGVVDFYSEYSSI